MNDYVSFHEAAHLCNEQAQYASRYVDGRHGYPNFSEGLRFQGDPRDYHDLLIHQDDVAEFVRRVTEHLKALGR